MVKKGDTLIEVTLAVGIFSMVAIAIVAVMSGGTSSAQAALETTLAREEIDTQAEALRFIHASYVASKDAKDEDTPVIKLWNRITNTGSGGLAIDMNGMSEEAQQAVTNYTPTSCQDFYNATNSSDPYAYNTKAFVINPHALSALNGNSSGSNNVLFTFAEYRDNFTQASTYPRLIFSSGSSMSDSSNLAADTSNYSNLYKAEGIYIIAVKDVGNTHITTNDPTTVDATKKTAAFYDFYIRTCWYGTDSEEPSTISTVIRLYDPNAI